MLALLVTGSTLNLMSMIGVCLDTGHTTLGRHWRRFLTVAASRLTHVHANDHRGQSDDHLPPGDGRIDCQAGNADPDCSCGPESVARGNCAAFPRPSRRSFPPRFSMNIKMQKPSEKRRKVLGQV